MLTSFSFKIFFILLREHLLSPATKHNKKEFFVLKNKLLTIEPTSVLRLFAASCAVRAELSKTITLIEGDKLHDPTGLQHQMFALKDTELFEFSTQHFDSDSNRIERGD